MAFVFLTRYIFLQERYGRGPLFSAITVEECGVSNAWSDLQHAPFVPSILCTQLEETSKDGNGESGRMEDVDYLKRVSVALGRAC